MAAQNKGSKSWIWILIALVIAGIIIKIMIDRKKDDEQTDPAPGSTGGAASTTTSSGSSSSALTNSSILKKGSKGDRVQWVQWLYNQKVAAPQGKTKLSEDGVFGAKTEAAVKSVMGKTTTSWDEFKNKLSPGSSSEKLAADAVAQLNAYSAFGLSSLKV